MSNSYGSVQPEEGQSLMDSSDGLSVKTGAAAPTGPVSTPTQSMFPSLDASEIDIEDVVHALESFRAVIKPVALVMLVASWAVVNVRLQNSQQLSHFLIYDESIDIHAGVSFYVMIWHAILNAMCIIGIFLVTTLFIVALYKFKCMNFMILYMVLSSTLLLGLMGGLLFYTAVEVFHIIISRLTFAVCLWNFAMVGIIAVFYQKGLDPSIMQGYLACTSVIMSWQLSTKLPEWTSWTLLVLLAFYDLFAVLSPVGPLRCLVELMIEQQSFLPGLLYEAEINYTVHGADGAVAGGQLQGSGSSGRVSPQSPASPLPGAAAGSMAPGADYEMQGMRYQAGVSNDEFVATSVGAAAAMDAQREMRQREEKAAKMVRDRNDGKDTNVLGEGGGGMSATQESIQQLASGEHTEQIKLGLGDFVFYSVLVAKAALYDWAALASCFLVILLGLSSTLMIVSVFRSAIPALPVSIGLGVMFYLLTRMFIVPYISVLCREGVLV